MLTLPRTDPRRFSYVHCLALVTHLRFQSSTQQGDLEQSIFSLTETIYLPIIRDTSPLFLNIVEIFYHLALSAYVHVNESSWPEDVISCIIYLRYLHAQWPEVSMKFPLPVTTALVRALAVQGELELGDMDEDIEEMADLCDELLNSDISTQP